MVLGPAVWGFSAGLRFGPCLDGSAGAGGGWGDNYQPLVVIVGVNPKKYRFSPMESYGFMVSAAIVI